MAEDDIPELMSAREKHAHWMKQQPGLLSTQLHRAIGGGQLLRGLSPAHPEQTMMRKHAHLIAGSLALQCIATCFLSITLTELIGSHAAVARLKSLIVIPGLWIMMAPMAAVGGSGMFLAKLRQGRLVDAAKKRIPFIAANGLLVLVPYAIVLRRWAAAGSFDAALFVVQTIRLIAGATNLAPMGLNMRDGLRMAGRLRNSPVAVAKAHGCGVQRLTSRTCGNRACAFPSTH